MNAHQKRMYQRLFALAAEARSAGFAVVMFTPDEVTDAHVDNLEGECVMRGNDWLDSGDGARPLLRWQVAHFPAGAAMSDDTVQSFECEAVDEHRAEAACEQQHPGSVIVSVSRVEESEPAAETVGVAVDADHALGALHHALTKAVHFIEDVTDEDPNRSQLFFEARAAWREAFAAYTPV